MSWCGTEDRGGGSYEEELGEGTRLTVLLGQKAKMEPYGRESCGEKAGMEMKLWQELGWK